jgi:hypothetical protein
MLSMVSYNDADAIENYIGSSVLFGYWKLKNSFYRAFGTPSLMG